MPGAVDSGMRQSAFIRYPLYPDQSSRVYCGSWSVPSAQDLSAIFPYLTQQWLKDGLHCLFGLMPKSNKFSLGGPDSMQFRCGTQNRYFGPPAFPDSVLFQNTIPNPPTFDYPLPRSSLSARRHRNIRTSQNTSAKSPQCSISITKISTYS